MSQFMQPGQIDPTYIDTDHDAPAMPKPSTPYHGDNPCPYWHVPQARSRKSVDLIEQECKKWFTRGVYIAGTIYVLMMVAVLLGKVMVMVIALK